MVLSNVFQFLKKASFVVCFVASLVCASAVNGQVNQVTSIGLTSNPQAFAAFSLRKLNSSYSGYAVRVRRSVDDAQADIAFDAAGRVSTGGSVATIAVAGTSGLAVGATMSFGSFMGSYDGYVTKWYDQSTNGNHASNNTTSTQPLIVTAGVFPGYITATRDTSRWLFTPNVGLTNTSAFTVLAAYSRFSPTSTGIMQFYHFGSGSGTRYWHGLTMYPSPAQTGGGVNTPQLTTRPNATGSAQYALNTVTGMRPFYFRQNEPFLFTAVQTANNSNDAGVRMFVNENFVGTPRTNVVGTFTTSSVSPVNNSFTGGAPFGEMRVYEFIILNSALTDADALTAQNAIMTAYPDIRKGAPVVYYPGSWAQLTYNKGAVITPLKPLPIAATATLSGTSYSISPAAGLTALGLAFNQSTGELSGKVTSITTGTAFTVTATNANGSFYNTYFTVRVNDSLPSNLNYPTPNYFQSGVPITGLTPGQNTGGAIVKFSVSPALPGGLNLNITTGVISGTPTVTGQTSHLITAVNSGGSVTQTIEIQIVPSLNAGSIGSGQSICYNATPASLNSVSAASGGTGTITYQWQQSTSSATDGFVDIQGASSASYSPGPLTKTTYFRRGASTSNIGVQYSNVITVSVSPLPVITGQPLSEQLVCSGTVASLSVSGTGISSFQWYSNTVNSNTGGTTVNLATFSTYTVPGTTVAGSRYFYVVVTGQNGCGSVASAVATVTTAVSVVGLLSPSSQDQVVCNNKTALLTALNNNPPAGLSYQWYNTASNTSSGGLLIAGATGSTYTVPATTTAGDRYFYLVVTGVQGCGSVVSPAIKVTTLPQLAFATQPAVSTTVAYNRPVTLSATVTGGSQGIVYQWYSNTTPVNSGGTAIPDATSDSYIVPASTANGSRYYYLVVTDACGSIRSNISVVNTAQANSLSLTYLTVAEKIVNSSLQPSMVLVSDTGRAISSSSVTANELNQLSGVNGNVQQQLNALSAGAMNVMTQTGNLVRPTATGVGLQVGGPTTLGKLSLLEELTLPVTKPLRFTDVSTGRKLELIAPAELGADYSVQLPFSSGTLLTTSDTSAMLSAYAKRSELGTLSAIKEKLSYADTAVMLSGYLRVGNLPVVTGKVSYSDTASMLANYAKLSSLPVVTGKVNYTDTTAMLNGYARKGQVVRYSDTATMLSRYARTSSIPVVTGKMNYTDTASMLSNYARTSSIPVVTGKVNYTDTATMLGGYLRTVTPQSPTFGGLSLQGGLLARNAVFNGKIGIGTGVPDTGMVALAVNGEIVAKMIRVSVNGWSDYVFEPAYKLRPLTEVEAYVKQHGHLPDVPSAKEVATSGISVGDNQAVLLRKIEELTLYLIEMQKENRKQQEKNAILEERVKQLESKGNRR